MRMYSFKEFITPFEKEIHDLFFEMALRTGVDGRERFPIWDEHDQRYYKYIIDNVPDKIKENPELLRKAVQQALFWRYGDAERRGILHEKNVEQLPDKLNKDFNVQGAGRFTIKDIPMFPKQLIEKFSSRGGN